jgi:hypothetical protein
VDEVIESVIGSFFGKGSKSEKFADIAQSVPGSSGEGGGIGGSVGSVAGAALGSFFGPAGTAAGGAIGGFAGKQFDEARKAPSAPSGTIESGHTNPQEKGSESIAALTDHMQRLAVRGIQTKIAAAGQKKVF